MFQVSSNFDPLNGTTNLTNSVIIPIKTKSSQGLQVQYPYSTKTDDKVAVIILDEEMFSKETQETQRLEKQQDWHISKISSRLSFSFSSLINPKQEKTQTGDGPIKTRERSRRVGEEGQLDAILASVVVKGKLGQSDISAIQTYFSRPENLEAGAKAFINLIDAGQSHTTTEIFETILTKLPADKGAALIKSLDTLKKGELSKSLLKNLPKLLENNDLEKFTLLMKVLDNAGLSWEGKEDPFLPLLKELAPKIASLAKSTDISRAAELINQLEPSRAKQLANFILKDFTLLNLGQGAALVMKLLDKEIKNSTLSTFMRTDSPTTAFFSVLQSEALEKAGVKDQIIQLGLNQELFSRTKNFKNLLKNDQRPSIFVKKGFAKACNQSFNQLTSILKGKIPAEMQTLYSYFASSIEERFKNDPQYHEGHHLNLVRSFLFLRGIQPMLILGTLEANQQTNNKTNQPNHQHANRVLQSAMILGLVQQNSFDGDYQFLKKGFAEQKKTRENLNELTETILGDQNR